MTTIFHRGANKWDKMRNEVGRGEEKEKSDTKFSPMSLHLTSLTHSLCLSLCIFLSVSICRTYVSLSVCLYHSPNRVTTCLYEPLVYHLEPILTLPTTRLPCL